MPCSGDRSRSRPATWGALMLVFSFSLFLWNSHQQFPFPPAAFAFPMSLGALHSSPTPSSPDRFEALWDKKLSLLTYSLVTAGFSARLMWNPETFYINNVFSPPKNAISKWKLKNKRLHLWPKYKMHNHNDKVTLLEYFKTNRCLLCDCAPNELYYCAHHNNKVLDRQSRWNFTPIDPRWADQWLLLHFVLLLSGKKEINLLSDLNSSLFCQLSCFSLAP